ncbi:MAG: branched-chain amino acid ABC transporter permease [Thermoprotei archaeon]|nr:branched-chain amino acid ABC transporter permease [Thermoprotei archaeon]
MMGYRAFLLTVFTLLILVALRFITEAEPIGFITPQFVTFVMFYVALGLAFNIFIGMTGYVDFGYVAFMALGSYAMASAINRASSLSLPGYGAIILGLVETIVLTFILALIVGGIALRLRGAYFAIATISVNEGLRFLVDGLDIWGGSAGIYVSGPLIRLVGHEAYSFIALIVSDLLLYATAFIALIITFVYLNSRIGYALKAIREDEDAAKVMGVNTTFYKVLAFSTSGILGGLIGASWALKLAAVYPPEAFNIFYTVEAIVIVMLGGAGTFLGPIVGGAVYGGLKYVLSGYIPGYQLLIFAPILIAIIVMVPQGVIGFLRERSERLREFIA